MLAILKKILVLNDRYKSITSDLKRFKRINPEQLHNIMNSNKNDLIYIGRSTCPSCRKFIPILYKVLIISDIKISYFDVDAFDTKAYSEIFNEYNINKIPTVMAPTKTGIKTMQVYRYHSAIKGWIEAII